MSTPNDPHQPQPQQPQSAPTGEQPAYPAQPYDYQQAPPYGYPQYGPPYGGYPQYGGYPVQPPAGPPRRPGTLIAAGVLWILVGALMLLVGVVWLLVDRIPDLEREVHARYPDATPEFFQFMQGFGLASALVGVALMALGIPVFGGALWARIATAVIGALVGLITIVSVLVPLLVIAAIVLQFLPASNAYAKAKRVRAA